MPSIAPVVAPIGLSGSAHEVYHSFRRLHHLAREAAWGEWLAPTVTVLPEALPAGPADPVTLRWAVRTDGEGRSMLFVNNSARGLSMEVCGLERS
jgi:hypothetical protein